MQCVVAVAAVLLLLPLLSNAVYCCSALLCSYAAFQQLACRHAAAAAIATKLSTLALPDT